MLPVVFAKVNVVELVTVTVYVPEKLVAPTNATILTDSPVAQKWGVEVTRVTTLVATAIVAIAT